MERWMRERMGGLLSDKDALASVGWMDGLMDG